MTSISNGTVACALALLVSACTATVTPVSTGDDAGGTANDAGASGPADHDASSNVQSGTDSGSADAGIDSPADASSAKDSGPPPTDVAGSDECTAYCAKAKSECNATCHPSSDCAIPQGQCAASTKAYLACEAQNGQWYCGADGFSIVSSCTHDTSVCN